MVNDTPAPIPPNSTPDPLCGFLVIDKPYRLSSTSIVRIVKRRAGKAKTGHAGTLDPLASGVLICAVGRATKSINKLMDLEKRYVARIDLSAFSTTEDLEGEITPVDDPQPPAKAQIDEVLQGQFTGAIMQRPPNHSAIWIDGKRAYNMARRGRDFEIKSRPVVIHHIELQSYNWPELIIDVRCAKGTYIRSLARDIGQALGVGGYLAALRRTAVGPFTVGNAWLLDDVPDPIEQHHLRPVEDLD